MSEGRREPALEIGSSAPTRRWHYLPENWRRFGKALAVYAVIGVLMKLFFSDWMGLYLVGLYMIPANSVIPLPHEPGLFWVAPLFPPLLIAIFGTFGVCIAGFLDYQVLHWTFERPKIEKMKKSRLYRLAVDYTMRYPFATIFVFAFTPGLPYNYIRVMAPAMSYPAGRYITAIGLGRFFRFWLLAAIGESLHIPWWVLLAMAGVLASGGIIGGGTYWVQRWRNRKRTVDPETQDR